MLGRRLFFTTFVAIHLIFVFLQIHKQIQFINESYRKQKNEKLYATLLKEKDTLVHSIQTLQNKEFITNYARTHLCMKAIHLKQVKRLHHDSVE